MGIPAENSIGVPTAVVRSFAKKSRKIAGASSQSLTSKRPFAIIQKKVNGRFP